MECVRLFLYFFLSSSAFAANVKHLTATPDTVVAGLTSSLTLRCEVAGAAPDVSSVVVIQLERLGQGGHQVPVATLHPGAPPALNDASFKNRAAVTGAIDPANVGKSYLQLVVDQPGKDDAGQYICVINVLDIASLLTNLADNVFVNYTEVTTTKEIRDVLANLKKEIDALKANAGNCSCGGGSTHDVTALKNDVDLLKQVVFNQGQTISQITNQSLISKPTGHNSNASSGMMVGFTAVGPSTANYEQLVWETGNNTFDLRFDRFEVKETGFYMFHVYDESPSKPQLALFVNDGAVAVSAKSFPVPAPTVSIGHTPPPTFASLSVSAVLHLNRGDKVAAKYVDFTQSIKASFSGVRIPTY